jgi:hypothetical protein
MRNVVSDPVDIDRSRCGERYGAGSNILQSMRRTAKGVHEELGRTSLQDRVPNVPQSLQEVREIRLHSSRFIALLAGVGSLVTLDGESVVAANRNLSGAQLWAKFAGMQLTDEVHYRLVYERDGTLRSVAMGVKKSGKWVVKKGQLCLYLQEPDDGCYDVALSGKTFTLTPAGLGSPLDGILQPISDPH